jgi:DNA-binding PadR family transcriptional regulator
MPRKRTVGLSAGEAVLGLVIEQPDSASRLGQRLVERFRSARFTSSTGHNALNRLAQQGLVRLIVGGGQSGGESYYEATPLGVEHFRAWLRDYSTVAPTLREELRAKVEFCAPEDLPQLIDAIRAEERACASMFAAAQGSLSEAELVASGRSSSAERWSQLTRGAALRDEAAMWGMRFKRLERLRARLEGLLDPAHAAEAVGSARAAETIHPTSVIEAIDPADAAGSSSSGGIAEASGPRHQTKIQPRKTTGTTRA